MISKACFVLIAVFGLFFARSHAAESPAELYWKAKLGNTPMPTILKDSLPQGSNVGSVKLNQNYGDGSSDFDSRTKAYAYALGTSDLDRATRSYALSSSDLDARTRNYALSSSDNLDAKTRNYALSSLDLDAKTRNYALSSSDLDAKTRNYALSSSDLDKATRNYKINFDRPNPGSKPQLPQDGRVLYFTDKDLFRVGAKMKLLFTKNENEAKFLPLQVSNSKPFSSNKLQVILNLLSVNPKTVAAQDIEKTIKECETKGVKGEVRYCATSLEAMINNVIITLSSGKNKVRVLSTEVEKESNAVMEYKIKEAQKIGNDEDNNVVCHKMRNPFAVFLCHKLRKTDAYVVSLVGAKGKETKAIAVCHKDTSAWNPEHLAFQVLKIKPGSKPVCHFLGANAVLWNPNY